ncbi:hypothetical protein [Sorangium atrum]|uniref:Uncharacterized protein n=1 Tax=Sorangium atrum TaxID=2995308 RepID=A0ABT5BWT2_9BACT|nr:hypothetical protein [Sorangium aterium]MDC0678635.1 hypothetical protein [Sorangium aterium]
MKPVQHRTRSIFGDRKDIKQIGELQVAPPPETSTSSPGATHSTPPGRGTGPAGATYVPPGRSSGGPTDRMSPETAAVYRYLTEENPVLGAVVGAIQLAGAIFMLRSDVRALSSAARANISPTWRPAAGKDEGRESTPGLSASSVLPSGKAFSSPGGRPIATLEQRSPSIIVSEPPGEVGVMISRRLTPMDMWSLQKEFRVEFALVYRTGMGRGGGGGTYWIYSGSVARVRPPIGPNIRLNSHTHPKGGDYGPSEQDLGFLKDLRKAGSPQSVSTVIEHDMNVIAFGQPRPRSSRGNWNMDDNRLKEFEHMWQSDKECYMLSEVEGGDSSSQEYAIVDISTNHGVIIEDNEVAHEVVRRMLEAGVSVGNPFDPKTRKEILKRRLRSSHENHQHDLLLRFSRAGMMLMSRCS